MRHNRGQLSLGLAFAFTAVLAMFSLVLRSSLLTREKMKLQQTTDFAALYAANVQRHKLNVILKINKMIEAQYWELVTEMAFPHCNSIYAAAASPTLHYNTLASIVDKIPNVKTLDPKDFLKNVDSKGIDKLEKEVDVEGAKNKLAKELTMLCTAKCRQFDEFKRGLAMNKYQKSLTRAWEAIDELMMEGNEDAYQAALSYMLIPKHLPVGLRSVVKRKYGEHVTPDQLKDEYEKGNLQEYLKYADANRGSPLFSYDPREPEYAQLEEIPIVYYDKPAAAVVDYICGPSIGTSLPIPRFVPTKMVKRGDYRTSYLAVARYRPVTAEIIKKFNLFLRNSETGEKYKELPLIRYEWERTEEMQAGLMAISLAKPYGGTFPQAGNYLKPYDLGNAGSEFTGAKVIGIADREEMDGFRFPLDQDGSVTEDYLH